MSGPFSTVAGNMVVGGSLLIPFVGAWTADLYLASDQAISGIVQVVIGNLSLSGAVVRSQAYGGQTRVRLVGGAGGWRTGIGSQGYGSASGVKLSTVMRDAANACGETVNVANDRTIGPGYARANDIASDILWQLLSQTIIPSWRIDTAGVTQLTAWPTTVIRTPFTVTDQRPDEGIAVVATEDYASWLPGCQFSSPLIAGTLTNLGAHYVWGNSGDFRFEVMTGADNLTASFDAIVQKQIAPLRFHGRYSYTISNPTTTTVDASPKDPDGIGLPDLQNVPLRSDSISTYTPPDGGDCDIMFLDGVPTKPICVWTSGAPTMAELLSGNNPIGLLGSQVTVFLPPTLPLSGVITILGVPNPFQGIATVVNPISGAITSGSAFVNSK